MTRSKGFFVAVALVAVAVLVPVAASADRPDDRPGTIGVGAVEQAGTPPFDMVGTADTVARRIEAGLTARGSVPEKVRPDDRAGMIGVGSVPSVPATQPAAGPGRDWSDPIVIVGLTGIALVAVAVVAFGVYHYTGTGPGRVGRPGRPAATH